jgi:serine phosphatase RsbU (regulator of sigma subunit)
VESDPIEARVTRMLDASLRTSPSEVLELLDLICELLPAQAARFHVADYSLRRLQQVDRRGTVGVAHPIAGTLSGRVFTSGKIQVAGTDPVVVSVPLVEGTCPIGVLELDVDAWDDADRALLDRIVAIFVMAWLLQSRYTDTAARARRSEPLSAAAEVQWDLLPPLACSTEDLAISGILEPAYDIGGDSFDYAFARSRVDFTIVDAIGHGMSAVLMSAAAINSLRNSRRAEQGIAAAYDRADRSIATQFGDSHYVTGVLGTLDLHLGTLTWINAGHVLPMLVRNGTYAGPLHCKPSLPLGLGGPVVEVAEHTLQAGDRVLFYTDGITEARSPDGSFFGDDRLADLLVRASLENLPVQETVRHLADSIVGFSALGLRDDATMLLMEYRPPAA